MNAAPQAGGVEEATGHRFAFVIPAYNHGGTLEGVIRGVASLGLPVFVVDDGSSDDTPAVLTRLADEGLPGLTVLTHPENRGKGAALMTGLSAAARVADWAVSIDADGQHDPADAGPLMDEARRRGRAIVIGNRLGMQGPHTPWTSRFGRGFSNFWVRASGGPPIADSQSGYRVYPLPDVLCWGSRSRRFQWEVEIVVLAHWFRVPVCEVDISVHYAPRGERISHFRPWVDFWRNSATFTSLIVRRIFVPRTRRTRLLPPPTDEQR